VERERYSDKYYETKWQLTAAIDSIPQGLIMHDSKANLLVINDRYKKMYGLPATIKAGLRSRKSCSMESTADSSPATPRNTWRRSWRASPNGSRRPLTSSFATGA